MTRIAVVFLAGLMLLSGACVIAVTDSSSGGQAWPIHSEYHKSLDLESGGVVNLENSNGDIEISGWTENKIDITAYRKRSLPSKAGLYFWSGRFSPADVQVKRTGEVIRIKTQEEGYKEDGSIVHYVLKVPRSVRLERIGNGGGNILISDVYGQAVVDAKEGWVGIENYSGSLDVRLERGRVEAEVLDLRPEDSIRISVDRGDIVIYLEPGISARFSLEAPEGNISSEIDLNQSLPARKVSSTTGDGGASLKATTFQGDIKIRKVEESP